MTGPVTALVKPLVEVVLPWLKDHVVEDLWALVSLKSSKDALLLRMNHLAATRNDLENQVVQMESPALERTNIVKLWMKSVDDLEVKVQQFEAKVSRSPSFPECCSPGLLWERYDLIRTGPDLARKVGELESQSTFQVLVQQAPWDPGRGLSDPPMVAAEETMEEIRRCLNSDQGIIGIYGMGGVGKSTLLRKSHRECRRSRQFDYVIRIELPREADVRAFARRSIADFLNLTDPKDLGEADGLRGYLGQMTFLLLLDNVWAELKLEDLGLAGVDLGAKRKIVFTTRLESVCGDMGAFLIKVSALSDGGARQLFEQSVNRHDIFHPSPIKRFVEDVVSECGGLPLALKIIGRGMSTKRADDDWRDAAYMLKKSPDRIDGVEEKVFKVLDFSFDNQLDENQKQCLLFCALFPDRHDISRAQLVEYWIAEELVGGTNRRKSLKDLQIAGRKVINRLISSCLLEEASNVQKEVRMHDMVRDVALWIAADKFLVSPRWVSSENDAEDWEEAQRISIMRSSDPLKLPREPSCPKLSTLIIRDNSSPLGVPKQFFGHMPVLRVLDFSGTQIEKLPAGVGKLRMLRYLNLSRTPIRSLPKEVGDLEQLRHLNLSYTAYLTTIPDEVISGLSKLWTLNMFKSGYDNREISDSSSCSTGDEPGQGISFAELEGWPLLQEFGLNVKTLPVLERLLSSNLLQKTTCLCLAGFLSFSAEHQSKLFGGLSKLQELHIGHFDLLRELTLRNLHSLEVLKVYDLPIVTISWKPPPSSKCRLRCLQLSHCHELKNLDWVKYFLCLETVSLSHCDMLQAVIESGGDEAGKNSASAVWFSRLREIKLEALPALTSICGRSLKFTSLQTLSCRGCPKLTTLPFHSGNVRVLAEIQGEQSWWDDLRWEPEAAAKSCFSPVFKPAASQPRADGDLA